MFWIIFITINVFIVILSIKAYKDKTINFDYGFNIQMALFVLFMGLIFDILMLIGKFI
jgi:hypothetical protein